MTTNTRSPDPAGWITWRVTGWSVAALLLLTPWVAMQFTDEVNWSPADFVVFAALLGGAGLAFELAVRVTTDIAYRAAVAVALASGVLLIWVNGAVGIIGAADNDFNLLFVAVLGVGVLGAGVTGVKPKGMTVTLLAMALVQALLTVIALILGIADGGEAETLRIIALNGFFIALYGLSAWLFRSAEKHRGP